MLADLTSLPVILTGFCLGMKHSLDADHLAAVSTLVTGEKQRWKSAFVGIYWGIGHSLSLLVAGGIIIIFDIRFGPVVSAVMETAVALMLLGLGVRILLRVRRGGTLHVHAHRHGGRLHIHPHVHEPGVIHSGSGQHDHRQAATGGKLPLLIGSVHGFAGSAALTLILLPTLKSSLEGIFYLIVFGVGSILGMALTTFLVSIPLSVIKAEGKLSRMIAISAGILSLIVGILLIFETGPVLFPG